MNYLEILEQKKDSIKDYEKLKRHLGKKIPHKFKNTDGQEDLFYFTPASYELYVEFMSLIPALEDKEVSAEALKLALDLMVRIVNESYPDWPIELARQFVANNFDGMMSLMDKIMPQDKKDVRKVKKIQDQLNRIKKKENVPENSREIKEQGPIIGTGPA